MRVLILGADGMLGMGLRQALQDGQLDVTLSARRETSFSYGNHESYMPSPVDPVGFSKDTDLSSYDFVINCIGVIKPRINESSSKSIQDAIEINSIFPHRLSDAAKKSGTRIIQIATDCVYSGDSGGYSEKSGHDPKDVYGKTKSLGEVQEGNFLNLRTSIIGAEFNRVSSLFEWFRNQDQDAALRGFTNHVWNGVSTFHFGRVVHGIIRQPDFISGTHHLLPSNVISKYDLLLLFKEKLGRDDLKIEKADAPTAVDRTLSTNSPHTNASLWAGAGYSIPPSIEQIVQEMPAAVFDS